MVEYYLPLIKDIERKVELLQRQGIQCQFTIITAHSVDSEKTSGQKSKKKSIVSAVY